MTVQRVFRMSSLTAGVADADIDNIIKELSARQKSGEKVMIPGESNSLGTVSSSVTKAVGADALHTQGINKAAFQSWQDPSQNMNPTYREHMLTKSLKEAGYPFACPWSELGEFLQDGWRSKRTGEQDAFKAKYANSWKGMQESGGFFKARGMSSLTGADGGFLINPEIAPKIESLFVQNDLASRVDTLPTNATIYNLPRADDLNRNDGTRHGGVQSYWIDEADPLFESRPKFAFTEIRMRKLIVLVFMTSEIMNDTPYAVETYVRNAVREEINFALSRAIMWGNGNNEPLGFANASYGGTISVPAEGSQTAFTFNSANALNMSSRMWRNSAGSAVWLHHQSAIPQIGSMSIGNFPVTVNIQNGGLSGPVTSTLLNRPLIESELCSPLGNVGDVWYADLKQYKAITQSLVREDVSIHVEFLTDQQCLRFIVRFGGRPLLPTVVTPFQSPTATTTAPTQSSFIKLAARTS